MSRYRVTVRRGPKVEHSTHDSLDDALVVVEADARTAPRRGSVEFLSRHYEPGDQVAVRIELKGPRVRVGVDVRGDGEMVAWSGRNPACGDRAGSGGERARRASSHTPRIGVFAHRVPARA